MLRHHGQCRLVAALTIALIALTASPSARAEQRPEAKARAHYEQGVIEYNLRHYDPAIAEFEQAYRLSPQPVFLFNIAQAHRKAGRLEDALYFYKRYLNVAPDAPERETIKKRIAELEELQAKQREAATKPIEPPAPQRPSQDEKSDGKNDGKNASAAEVTDAPTVPPPAQPSPPLAAPVPEPAGARVSRFEVAAAGGAGIATSGGPSGHSAGPALALAAGYVHPVGSVALRLGLVVGLFRLGDEDSTISFYTVAVEPGIRLGAQGARTAMTLGVGVGMTAIAGLSASSSMLTGVSSVQGAQLALVLRPSAGLSVALTEGVDLRVSGAFAFSPKPDEAFAHGNLTRIEILAGIGARF